MWNRNEPRDSEPQSDRPASPAPPQPARPPAASSSSRSTQAAVIGPSISIRGDLTGEEDLVIEGRVEGEVVLEKHRVEVGQGGRVKADILAKTIHVLGEVDGNLAGDEEVIIRASGRVVGNISAPRVTLEDGCNFRGTVDMSPQSKKKQSANSPAQQGQKHGPKPGHKAGPGPKQGQNAGRQPIKAGG